MKRLLFIWCAVLLSAWGVSDTDLELERESQTSTAFTILFDNSGSMDKDGKIRQAKQAFSAWLSAQDPSHAFSLIHFLDGGTVAVPLENNTLQRTQAVVKKLTPQGQTPIVNCLKLAHKNIIKRRENFSPYERHIVVVFTDGYESLDPDGNRGVVREIRNLTADGIEVTGIGFHGQGSYMSKSATQYFDASNTEELKRSLDKVSAEIDPNVEVMMTEQDFKQIEGLKDEPVVVASYDAPEEEKGFPKRILFFIFAGIFLFSLVKKLL